MVKFPGLECKLVQVFLHSGPFPVKVLLLRVVQVEGLGFGVFGGLRLLSAEVKGVAGC